MIDIEADALALALEAGAIDTWDVQAWADTRIAAQEEVDARLIELSGRTEVSKTLSILHSIGAGRDKSASARLVCGHLLRALIARNLGELEAAHLLERMARGGYIPEKADSGTMWSLADDFELVACGEYPSELGEKLKGELREFLEQNAV